MPPFDLHMAFFSFSWEGTIHRCDVPGMMEQGSELGPAGIALLYLLLIMALSFPVRVNEGIVLFTAASCRCFP